VWNKGDLRLVFDDDILFLEDIPETVPYTKKDDRVDKYRAREKRQVSDIEGTLNIGHNAWQPNLHIQFHCSFFSPV
jgi:hypothetical protein